MPAYLGQFNEGMAAGATLVLKEGDCLSVGARTLRFVNAPMVHCPEVIMTYCPEEKVLFSADGFGKLGGDELKECSYIVDVCHLLEEDNVFAYKIEYTALGIKYDEMICFYEK